jgi:hypothetical protein
MRLLSDWLVHMVHFWPADASVKFNKQTNLNLHKAIMVWGNSDIDLVTYLVTQLPHLLLPLLPSFHLHKAIMVWGNRFSHSTSSSFTSFTSFLSLA